MKFAYRRVDKAHAKGAGGCTKIGFLNQGQEIIRVGRRRLHIQWSIHSRASGTDLANLSFHNLIELCRLRRHCVENGDYNIFVNCTIVIIALRNRGRVEICLKVISYFDGNVPSSFPDSRFVRLAPLCIPFL